MKYLTSSRWLWFACVGAILAALSGCGRPVLPGQQFKEERSGPPMAAATDTPLPEQGVYEWGEEDAEVQVAAFYPIDEYHKELMDLLKNAATEKHKGKIAVKYVDYRTPQGRALFAEEGIQVSTVLINGENSIELKTEYGPRTVDFVRDVGRFWTLEDLAQAIDQAVAETYGENASG